jgi:1,4-alpha-glucan branching enzyme
VRLRLNRDVFTRGLCGQFIQVLYLDDERKVLAYHRWEKGGSADDIVVVANFLNEPQEGYIIGFPAAGTWKLPLNSDWQGHSADFAGHPSGDALGQPGEYDGFPFHAAIAVGPCSMLIFS